MALCDQRRERRVFVASSFAQLATALVFVVAPGLCHGAMPAPDVNVPVPKGAEHIVIEHGDTDARKVFSYFPYPAALPGTPTNMISNVGLYRLEISREGNVVAITTLKTMGRVWDDYVMKKLVTWKAKPGNVRAVDVVMGFHRRRPPWAR